MDHIQIVKKVMGYETALHRWTGGMHEADISKVMNDKSYAYMGAYKQEELGDLQGEDVFNIKQRLNKGMCASLIMSTNYRDKTDKDQTHWVSLFMILSPVR